MWSLICRYEFRESLGLLGVLSDNAFIDLLFNVFNKKRNNQVSFEEYIDGLRILTRGTQDEKLVCFVWGDDV